MGKNWGFAAQRKMGGSRLLEWKNCLLQLGMALGISGGVAWLFYDSVLGMLLFPFFVVIVRHFWNESSIRRKSKQLNVEFKDYMYAVSSALSAGYSIERAFLSGLSEMQQLYGAQSILQEYLGGMERRLGLQEPMERILADFAEKSKSEDVENFVEIFNHAKRDGGDFLHIIAITIGRICDKIEVSEEIHTVMAEKALEQKIMCVIPVGILAFFRVTSPDFVEVLYGNLLGVLIMTIALGLYVAAFFIGIKITEIEV